MIWNYMKLHVHIIMLQDVYVLIYIYLCMIYIHTYLFMQNPAVIYIRKPPKNLCFFPPSSSPQRWTRWQIFLGELPGFHHRLQWERGRVVTGFPPWSAPYGMCYYTWKTPINCKPFIVGIHLGYQKLDIFGKWKLKLIALPEIKTQTAEEDNEDTCY